MDGSRRVSVSGARLTGWLERYRSNHPDTEIRGTDDHLELHSPDGARAVLHVPFPPLPATSDPVDALVGHLRTERQVGLILARRGGYAIGVAEGTRLTASKVGGGYVQGKTKAGGWSQQRFARRRSNQAQQVFGAAADVAARLLLPRTNELAAVVLGGSRDAVDAVLADSRLAQLRPLVQPRLIDVPDPRLRILTEVASRLTDVTIELNSLA